MAQIVQDLNPNSIFFFMYELQDSLNSRASSCDLITLIPVLESCPNDLNLKVECHLQDSSTNDDVGGSHGEHILIRSCLSKPRLSDARGPIQRRADLAFLSGVENIFRIVPLGLRKTVSLASSMREKILCESYLFSSFELPISRRFSSFWAKVSVLRGR